MGGRVANSLAKSIFHNFTKSAWIIWGTTAATYGAGGWAVAGKFAVAGGTSLLNSWNQNATFGKTMKSLGISLLVSGAAQGAGYLAGKFEPQLLSKIAPRNPNHWLTMGDIGSSLWPIPAVKTGVIRFAGGVAGSLINSF